MINFESITDSMQVVFSIDLWLNVPPNLLYSDAHTQMCVSVGVLRVFTYAAMTIGSFLDIHK